MNLLLLSLVAARETQTMDHTVSGIWDALYSQTDNLGSLPAHQDFHTANY